MIKKKLHINSTPTTVLAETDTILMAKDAMEIHYFENPHKHGPFGDAGVGELLLTSSHVAVANAIKNATGVRITQLPNLP